MELDRLIRDPLGTFHDSAIERLEVDYLKRTVTLTLRMSTGDPDAAKEDLREATKPARLHISGLLFLVMEPPDPRYPYSSHQGLTVDAREVRPGETPGTEALPKDIPEGAFVHQFFVYEWNSFVSIAGTHAEFQWLD